MNLNDLTQIYHFKKDAYKPHVGHENHAKSFKLDQAFTNNNENRPTAFCKYEILSLRYFEYVNTTICESFDSDKIKTSTKYTVLMLCVSQNNQGATVPRVIRATKNVWLLSLYYSLPRETVCAD